MVCKGYNTDLEKLSEENRNGKMRQAMKDVTSKMISLSDEEFEIALCEAGKEGIMSRLLDYGMMPYFDFECKEATKCHQKN